MKYEIIAPSDKVYITAEDDPIAKNVCYHLGNGTYMLKNDKGELLTEFLDPNIDIEGKELEKYIYTHAVEIADALDSLVYQYERTSMNDIGKKARIIATALRATVNPDEEVRIKMMDDKEYISKEAFIAQQRKQYCENCERRKGTKNGKRIFVYEVGETPCRACEIEDMIDAVYDFPSADVAPVVHGHWITVYREDGTKADKCSVCTGAVKYFDYKYGWCPHCGAKMDESEE